MSSHLKNSLRNISAGLIKHIVSIIFPFVIRTLMIYKMGEEYCGITSLFSSILQVLSLSELGFSNAIIYSLYEPIAKNDSARVCALLGLFRRIYKICGLTILTLGLLACPFIKFLIKGTCPTDINVYTIYIILLLNTSASYLFCGYKSALFVAYQRADIGIKANIISNFCIYVMEAISIICMNNYYFYTISILLGTIVNNIILHFFHKKVIPNIFCKGIVEKREKRNLYNNVIALFGHQLDAVIINSSDNVVISTFLGLTMVTLYNNYYYVVSAVLSVLIMVANSFVASIGDTIVTKSAKENYKTFISFSYCIDFINVICTCLMLVLFQDFMQIWMDESRLLSFSTVLMMVICFYVRQMRRPVLTYKNAAGVWKEDKLKPFVAAVTNVILNIILVNYIGINGVVISTLLSMLLVEIPWETVALYGSVFKVNMKEYIFLQIKMAIKLVLISSVTLCLTSFIRVDSIIMLFVEAFVSVLFVVFSLTIMSVKDREFKNLIEIIKQIVKRKVKRV